MVEGQTARQGRRLGVPRHSRQRRGRFTLQWLPRRPEGNRHQDRRRSLWRLELRQGQAALRKSRRLRPTRRWDLVLGRRHDARLFRCLKEIGKPLVPMTGEANNGFLRAWKAAGADSMGPIYTPGLGTATVKAAMALLEGKPLYKAYYSDPEPITAANFDKYYRPDLNDAYWFPSTLPENVI